MNPTGIEWATHTWNPFRGCSKVSEACANCYAEATAVRMAKTQAGYKDFANARGWTGQVDMVQRKLAEPIRRKTPSLVFFASMSDVFHERLRDLDIAAAFGVMAMAPQHQFLVLTKRPGRALRFFRKLAPEPSMTEAVILAALDRGVKVPRELYGRIAPAWPLSNVWLGTTVENTRTAYERIPVLDKLPAAHRFVSMEPLLEFVDLLAVPEFSSVDWVIAGGETGKGARQTESDWFRAVRDACEHTGSTFFLKQHGTAYAYPEKDDHGRPVLDARSHRDFPEPLARMLGAAVSP